MGALRGVRLRGLAAALQPGSEGGLAGGLGPRQEDGGRGGVGRRADDDEVDQDGHEEDDGRAEDKDLWRGDEDGLEEVEGLFSALSARPSARCVADSLPLRSGSTPPSASDAMMAADSPRTATLSPASRRTLHRRSGGADAAQLDVGDLAARGGHGRAGGRGRPSRGRAVTEAAAESQWIQAIAPLSLGGSWPSGWPVGASEEENAVLVGAVRRSVPRSSAANGAPGPSTSRPRKGCVKPGQAQRAITAPAPPQSCGAESLL
ncbi:hypothetical protein VUR80DRAFT_7341 [Thermomyces stellatus]